MLLVLSFWLNLTPVRDLLLRLLNVDTLGIQHYCTVPNKHTVGEEEMFESSVDQIFSSKLQRPDSIMGLEKAGEKTIRMNKLRNGGFKEKFKNWKKVCLQRSSS